MTGVPVSVGALVGVDYLNEVARGHWRTVSAQTVVGTTEADLLNLTIDAGALTATRFLRLFAHGYSINNSGGSLAGPRLKLKLGGTTVIDTGVPAFVSVNSATGYSWRVWAEIQSMNATNAQMVSFESVFAGMVCTGTGALAGPAFTTGLGGHLAVISTTVPGMQRAQAYNTAAIDMTVAQALELSCINAGNMTTGLEGARVEAI